ncbi:protein-L-isoaspartate O-methyltransferase family protein [Microvirga pudoricolor]|uniref:protein-L-isoaspartate O-methyltransferase family protein n=1 Tax=Microvirga pudoricolor TaxID=2778729 RepID=UPI0019528088|nr:protein-L-isoaspartate O-methyltransferase [Microvirga pudoricolor]MBM6596125.1 protein-L-isoaspartate O-methyltransferase [Microvirga pudoricolor]
MTGDPFRPGDSLPVFDDIDRAQEEAVEAASFVLSLRARGIRDTATLRAMELVPREIFAPRRFTDLARTDVALPLACGQTMTAPRTVAVMLVALGVSLGQRVLEIGTGSGYVTALLCRLGADVLSLERFGTLAESATQHLRHVEGNGQARIEVGDGLAARQGEPFDRILLNGAVPEISECLTTQLAPGGRLVGALSGDGAPRMVRIDRDGSGELRTEAGAGLRIAPLVAGVALTL